MWPKYMIGIPYVTGPEFTAKALASLAGHHDYVTICDCSEPPQLPLDAEPIANPRAWRIDRPIVPLGFTQTMNYFQQLALRRGADVLFYMHNDAEAGEGTVDELLSRAQQYNAYARKWGVLLTNYDALAAFNVKMFADVGPWDARLFPYPYYADNDYYRRVKLAGYQIIETGLACAHFGSHSLKISPRYRFLNHATFGVQQQLFVKKWGFDPGEEGLLWEEPFNGLLPDR